MSAPDSEELLTFLKQGRQVRTFSEDPISRDDLTAILEVARWTGSAGNYQPWQFLVVSDPEGLKEIARGSESSYWVADAPLAIGLDMDREASPALEFDEGRLAERLTLAARARGLGAGIAWAWEEASQDRLRAHFGVPEGRRLAMFIALGQPGSSNLVLTPNTGRKALTESVVWNRFGEKQTVG